MEINKLDVNEFWEWFSCHYDDFGENFENNALLNELDVKITSFGELAWEVGPGVKAANQLVISPSGDLDLLPLTKEIISYAKAIPNWEFHYAKPPKDWDFTFDFEKEDGKQIEINASNWKYVLLRYEDGMFEIIIQTYDLQGMSEDDKWIASEILLDGVLGEEKRMLFISDIDVVKKFEKQYENKWNEIKNLNNQFNKLISSE